jgi:Ca2+-binding EF-hand superfamily protein
MGPGMSQGTGRGQHMMPGMGKRARVDQNRDGFVAAEEADAWYKTAFATFDSNKDGSLARDEYLGTHMGRGPGTGPRAAERREIKAKSFGEMDKDRDAKATNAEFLAWHQERYKTADTNHDGKVNVTEFYAAMRP